MAKILIADDEKWYMDGVITFLKYKKHEIIFATTGNEVLQLVDKNGSIDILILDIMMPWSKNLHKISVGDLKPGVNCGIDLCKIIRQEKKLSIPIIIHSVLPKDDVRALFRLGDIIYLQKGSSNEEINDTINKLLQKRKRSSDC